MTQAPLNDEIREMLDWPEDRLCEAFALRQGLLGHRALPPRKEEILRIADAWIKQHWESLRQMVCGSPKVKALFRSPKEGDLRLHLVLTLSELLGHPVVRQAGVAPLAVLLVKMGIDKLCADCWAEKSP